MEVHTEGAGNEIRKLIYDNNKIEKLLFCPSSSHHQAATSLVWEVCRRVIGSGRWWFLNGPVESEAALQEG